MPKKKLTKAQVRKTMQSAKNAIYNLFMDKFNYGSKSEVTISTKKLEEMYFPLMRAKDKL
jgi:hypothetical protein